MSDFRIENDSMGEVRVPVQAKGKCRTGRVWDWIGDVGNPYIVFEFTPDRTNVWPIAWLKGYQGHLQADAGSSYAALYRLGTIIEVACWAHARRRFFDARAARLAAAKASATARPAGPLHMAAEPAAAPFVSDGWAQGIP